MTWMRLCRYTEREEVCGGYALNWRLWGCCLQEVYGNASARRSLLSALVSAGFSLAAVFSHDQGGTVALYSASRSVALAFVVCGVEFLGSRRGIAAMAFTMGLVQAFDAVIGAHS